MGGGGSKGSQDPLFEALTKKAKAEPSKKFEDQLLNDKVVIVEAKYVDHKCVKQTTLLTVRKSDEKPLTTERKTVPDNPHAEANSPLKAKL